MISLMTGHDVQENFTLLVSHARRKNRSWSFAVFHNLAS